MKKLMVSIAVIGLFLVSGFSMAADADMKGAVPGKWTMDASAAGKVAKEKDLPILLNFSGSDWCGWCKLMEKNVFSQKEWKDYAKDNIMMVLIDFPKDSSLVPDTYKARNEMLKKKYDVSGFPTFIVLDSDGLTQLGQLGAGRDKTPASFIGELNKLFRYRPASVEAYVKTLKSKAKAEYVSITSKIDANTKAIAEQKQLMAQAGAKIEELESELEELMNKARELRVANLGAEAVKEYKKLESEFEAAKVKFQEWISTSPERSEENGKIYKEMTEKLQELSEKLSAY